MFHADLMDSSLSMENIPYLTATEQLDSMEETDLTSTRQQKSSSTRLSKKAREQLEVDNARAFVNYAGCSFIALKAQLEETYNASFRKTHKRKTKLTDKNIQREKQDFAYFQFLINIISHHWIESKNDLNAMAKQMFPNVQPSQYI